MEKVTIHPEVEIDLHDIRAWYVENVDAQTAQDCINEIYGVMAEISDFPLLYSLIEEPFRRALCKRFPYKVVFESLGDQSIFVLSVFHEKRHPDTWKGRSES